jgi:hypothetical protein
MVCSYNDEGIWNWNVHDGDWIYQVFKQWSVRGMFY